MDPMQQLEQKREVWRRDILQFCDDVLYWRTGRGVEKWSPYGEQAKAIKRATATDRRGRPKHKTVAFCWAKRQGKSTAAAAILAWSLVTGSNAHSVVCSNSRENAMTVTFGALLNFIRNSPVLQALIPEGERQRSVISCPLWDNWVRALPCNASTVQGVAITAGGWAVFDDAHDAPLDVLDMVASQCENPEARVLVPSMIGSTKGFVYRLWETSKTPAGKHINFDYWHGDKANRNPYVSKKWLEQRRAEVPPPVYAVLHENEPGEGADALFDLEQLLACRENWQPPTTAEEFEKLSREVFGVHDGTFLGWDVLGNPLLSQARGRQWTLGAGIDRSLGKGRDETVFSVVGSYTDEAGAQHYAVLRCQLIPDSKEASLVAAAEDARKVFGRVDKLIAETYQMMDAAPKVAQALGCRYDLESAGSQAQAAAFNELWQLVNEGRFHYSGAMEKLHEQLAGFQINTDGRLPSFTGGSGAACDDYVYAACWARVAAHKPGGGGGVIMWV
ncbi:MAG: hypothetical protein ABFE07_07340 [Armatimonadia bacterium]